jgi:predicted transcriptional regulator
LLSERKEAACIIEEFREKNSKLEVLLEKTSDSLRRRDRHDIIVEILKTAREGEKKTYIMYKARLSHSQLKLYLGMLNRNGMIVNDSGVYKTTSKGLSFIKEFESVNHLFHQ